MVSEVGGFRIMDVTIVGNPFGSRCHGFSVIHF